MSGKCDECGESTTWDPELGSAICTHCGTLVDPTQSVLTSHLEPADVSGRELPWYSVRGSTLKGRNGWALAGQGKEVRDRNNTIAMHEFLRSISTRMSQPGSSVRAQGIFDQAMSKGHFRWGRKAKIVAGASLAIALREAHRSDSIRDIAYLLDEPSLALTRAFAKVTALLELTLTSADPAVHLPALHTHLIGLLEDPPATLLPVKLRTVLVPIRPQFQAVISTATSLSGLVSRTDTFAQLSTPPTACALLMLALEAELLDSLPHAGMLAQALAARLGAKGPAVMQRYKVLYDLVERWIRELPWLQPHERKGDTGRSKVAKRVVVARGLKDVVQFQEEIWRKKLEASARPSLQLDLDSEFGDSEDGSAFGGDARSEAGSSTGTASSGRSEDGAGPPSKKRKTGHERSVARASHFLLQPLSGPSRTCSTTPDILTHLLTADPADLSHVFAQAPTRLQLLVASRGSADETCIADDELFAEGELDAYLRSEEEVNMFRTAMGWDTDAADSETGLDSPGRKKRKRRESSAEEGNDFSPKGKGKGRAIGMSRINMDAFAKLLDPSSQLGIVEDDEANVDTSDMPFAPPDDGEVVEEWRPLSPGGGGFDEERYNS